MVLDNNVNASEVHSKQPERWMRTGRWWRDRQWGKSNATLSTDTRTINIRNAVRDKETKRCET